MTSHTIVGAGATARATALLLAGSGDRVRMVSRSGNGPDHPLVERIALDANDADRLTEAAEGSATLFNAAMPPYHTWPETIPPLFGAILEAARRTGANYVMLGNLYGYGPPEGTLTEDHPLDATGPKGRVRARMWREALDSGVPVTEVRAGQFYGPGAYSIFNMMVVPKVLAGRLALVPAEFDVPHAFTAIGDAAAALVAVSRDERAFGRAWHAPVGNVPVRELATTLADLAGAPRPRLETMSDRELTLLALSDPFWEELWETSYMSHRPFTVDSTRIEETFGVKPTVPGQVLAETLSDGGR
ncbi:NAD-dependent epimerase [Actinomadura namibiensis]|uniref:Nucleoside-diphosphate-sugar epimerase n=1 Tax=Actinomadura namibiensis TaxID=182080 RepID=A0A7W3QMH5_ACTNM|nr:NAD-dependent epimerase [Actinomadura namibiensis]MBA8952018.1 nucleoside-diphosphate-sugar epimerase [Actinomadura namibiensis]